MLFLHALLFSMILHLAKTGSDEPILNLTLPGLDVIL